MKYTIKTYIHNSTTTKIDDDFIKCKDYFKSKGIDLVFDIEKTDVPKWDVPPKLFKEGNYDVVMYVYQRGTFWGDTFAGLAFNITPNLRGIYASVSTPDDNVDFTWKHFAHEIIHTLFYKFKIAQQDPMDRTLVGGQWVPYWNNDQPNSEQSNYGYAWKALAPYLQPTGYKYFKPSEVVGLKPELVKLLDKMRGECGFPFIINSGLRTQAQNDALKDSVSDSAHLSGLACDLAINDSLKRFKLITVALNNGITRIGVGKGFIHIDIAPDKVKNVIWHYY